MTKKVKERFLKAMRLCIANRWNGVRNKKMFAAELGITPQLINNLVSDPKRIPTVEQICLICQRFAISPTYIILGKEPIRMIETASLEDRIKRLERATKAGAAVKTKRLAAAR